MKGRRRGAGLEDALLEAAWLELVERGYAGLSMEAVAQRAGTSRPVLARRWTGKAEITIAALRRQREKHPLDVPDRGDVRSELLEFLERACDRAIAIAIVFTLFSSSFFQDTGSTPEDLRAALIKGGTEATAEILNRAVKRGEIDPEKLIPPVTTLLGDLFRGYALMNFAPPPPELRTAWVDRVFLPLVRAG